MDIRMDTSIGGASGKGGGGAHKVYTCPTCSKTFGRRDYLERHILNHQKPSEVCPQCGKAFARADVLRKHLTTSCPSAKGQSQNQSLSAAASGSGSGSGAGTGAGAVSAGSMSGKPRGRAAGQGQKGARSASRGASSELDVRMSKTNSPVASATAAEGQGQVQGPYTARARGSISVSAAGSSRAERSEGGAGNSGAVNMGTGERRRDTARATEVDYDMARDRTRDRDRSRDSNQPREGKRRRSSPSGSYISSYTNGTAQMSNYWTKGLSEGLTPANLARNAGASGAGEVTGGIPFVSSASVYSQSRGPQQVAHVHAAPSLREGHGQGHGSAQGYPAQGQSYPAYAPSIPGSIGIGQTDTPMTSAVNPDLIGENMSELLQWLFQPPVPEPTPTYGHDTSVSQHGTAIDGQSIPPYVPTLIDQPPRPQGQIHTQAQLQLQDTYDMPRSGSSTLPTPVSATFPAPHTQPNTTGGNTPATLFDSHAHSVQSQSQNPNTIPALSSFNTPPHPTDPSSQSPHKGNTAPLPISFVAPFPPVQEVQTKEPQPIHPYTHPNKWKAGLFPPFVERSPRRAMPVGRDVLSEVGRLDMLRLFDATEADARILSLDRMRYYLDIFFKRFASLYPIIHRPSLPYRSLAADLLLAMIAIGIAYSGDSVAIHTAIRVARQLRYRIFMCLEDEARAPVHVLQTALLVNHFSRSYGDSRQFDSGQLWHPPSIIACRLSGVFLPKFTPPGTDGSIDPLAYWLEWVEEEERKRIGYFAFMMDIENVALFKQLLQCVSLQTEMPLGTGPWQAQDPYEWNEMLRTYPLPLSFRTSLRHVISLGFIPPNLDDSHLWLVLHGLLSTSCSLLWRDMGDLSMIGDTHLTQWKSAMRGAFDTWRNYILALNSRANLASASSHTVTVPNGVQVNIGVGIGADTGGFGPDALSSVPQSTPVGPHLMHHAAPIPMIRRIGIPFCIMGCLVLLTDTEQVRIYAGAMSISGRPIAPGEWTAASAYVNTWARSQDGAYACHYAALLLDEVYKEDWTISPTIIPWCAYVASLIIWTYTNILDGYEPLNEPFIRFPPSPQYPNARFPGAPAGGGSDFGAPLPGKANGIPQIDPTAASVAAEAYVSNILACPHPFSLPDIPKSRCGGVMAYTAHQLSLLDRGMLSECCGVLYGLMREGMGQS